MHQQLINRLLSCPCGNGQHAINFEDITTDIFKFLFHPTHIDEPKVQTIITNPNRRRDIILPVTAETGFFYQLSLFFTGDLLLVECKNYTNEITHTEILQVLDYLDRPSLAKIAFIIARNGINANATQTIKEKYLITGKLIIALTETDLIEILNNHSDPIPLLRQKYQNQKINY